MRTRSASGDQVLSALLTARPGKHGELQQTLRSLRTEIRQQPGCVECSFGQGDGGDSHFLLFMVWKDLPSLKAHMDSEAFRVLLGATSVLCAPATFRFIAAEASVSRLESPVQGLAVSSTLPGSIS